MSSDNLPDGWTRAKFGDVVRNCNDNSRDLDADGIDQVVGLDHLDPGSLRLARWDNLADLPDGTTFTRKFKPGQVLFGKRRAYQRKVAVADFDGVCSGDILVFEPADKRMLAAFLPYVVQSDGFFDHALGTSAGSLSPRTKWAELAKYEFALPPLDEQRQIVELLSAADGYRERIMYALKSARSRLTAVLHRLDASAQTRCRLGDLVEIERGTAYKSSDYVKDGEGRPFLNLKCVTRQGSFSPRGVKWVRADFAPTNVASPGDLFFANTDLTPDRLLVGAPFFFRGLEASSKPCFSMDLSRLNQVHRDMPLELVYHLLNIPRVRARMRALTGGSTVGHLRLADVPEIELPRVEDPLVVLTELRSLDHLAGALEAQVSQTQAVRHALRERLLEVGDDVH